MIIGLGALFAISSLILNPFGSVEELAKAKNPWYGFTVQDPVLTVIRLQRVDSKSCAAWTTALRAEQSSLPLPAEDAPKSWGPAWRAWEPWTKDELSEIQDCRKSPCDVKVDRTEGKQMGETKEADRLQTFLSIVTARLIRYEQTQERKEYEFPGKLVDPWVLFEKQGFRSGVSRPEKPSLWVRRVDFAPGKIKAIHQVLDHRFALAASKQEATTWIRDVYTDHYFDSWGEWMNVQCDVASGSILLTQAVLVEFDQLKKTDIFSSIMKGKVRSTFDEGGRLYLDRRFERMAKHVATLEAEGK